MHHRHLNHEEFTLAAIDDVIGRGQKEDWAELMEAIDHDALLRGKVSRICAARISDPYAQRYHFWSIYANASATT